MLTLVTTVLVLGLGQISNSQPIVPVRDAKYWAWTTHAWTVKNSDFAAFRGKADGLAARQPPDIHGLVKTSLDARAKFGKTSDTWLLLKWAYAAHLAAKLDARTVKQTEEYKAADQLERAKPIPSYEYARTRFLIHSDMFPKKYIPVGLRLLKKHNHDYLVRHVMVTLYLGVDRNESKKRAVQLVKDFPKKANAYAVAGDAFYIANLAQPSRADLVTAKAYYEDFLRRASTSNPNIELVNWRLENIRKKLGSER